MRFLFDEMLKKLAKWCRIFGIDSEHFTGKTDSELLEYAKGKDLVFVTRDEELAGRCGKHGIRVVFIKSTDVEEQIRQIIDETKVKINPEQPRCSECNGELEMVEKNEILDELPAKVRAEKFWRCKGCKKIYWVGSHWKNIGRLYLSLKDSKAI